MQEYKNKDNSYKFHNMDCLIAMKEMKDNQFDLAIVDPPYGMKISGNPFRQRYDLKQWDIPPNQEYFNELFRVSKNQIIWGGNYFNLPPSQGFLIWDKVISQNFTLAMCEFAWMSFKKPAKIWRKCVLAEKNKIHPTQKPILLYKWLLQNYAKKGDTILDTHIGSGSSAIACYLEGYDFTGFELDIDYYNNMLERFVKHYRQPSLF